MIIYYIYKIHFLCGFPSGRYYIGKHKHSGSLSNDKYTGSGNFCKAYFKKYGKKEGITYIKEYKSQLEASTVVGLDTSSAISKCCISKQGSAGGFIWRFKGDPAPTIKDINIYSIPILQYNKSGDIIATFSSIIEASNITGICADSISGCCSHKRKSGGGYI